MLTIQIKMIFLGHLQHIRFSTKYCGLTEMRMRYCLALIKLSLLLEKRKHVHMIHDRSIKCYKSSKTSKKNLREQTASASEDWVQFIEKTALKLGFGGWVEF